MTRFPAMMHECLCRWVRRMSRFKYAKPAEEVSSIEARKLAIISKAQGDTTIRLYFARWACSLHCLQRPLAALTGDSASWQVIGWHTWLCTGWVTARISNSRRDGQHSIPGTTRHMWVQVHDIDADFNAPWNFKRIHQHNLFMRTELFRGVFVSTFRAMPWGKGAHWIVWSQRCERVRDA